MTTYLACLQADPLDIAGRKDPSLTVPSSGDFHSELFYAFGAKEHNVLSDLEAVSMGEH